MSFFNWFSGKSAPSAVALGKDSGSVAREIHSRSRSMRDKTTAKTTILSPDRLTVDSGNRSEERKLKRHARREQLYQAVREAFTHAGVLSATYRFKVLSLDHAGNEFMVMMDVDQFFDHRAAKLADIESKIVQMAKTHHEIRVTSVYWRVSMTAAVASDKVVVPKQVQATAAQYPQHPEAANVAVRKAPPLRYEPIQDDEVAAFKQALGTASAASASRPAPTDAAGKARNSPRSYALLTGFEDTEMFESAATPVLSATQYGDLN